MGSGKSWLKIIIVPLHPGHGYRWMVGTDVGQDEFKVLKEDTAPTKNEATKAARIEAIRIRKQFPCCSRRGLQRRRLLDCAASIARKVWAYGRRPKK